MTLIRGTYHASACLLDDSPLVAAAGKEHVVEMGCDKPGKKDSARVCTQSGAPCRSDQ